MSTVLSFHRDLPIEDRRDVFTAVEQPAMSHETRHQQTSAESSSHPKRRSQSFHYAYANDIVS